jgi:hypothetical protein
LLGKEEDSNFDILLLFVFTAMCKIELTSQTKYRGRGEIEGSVHHNFACDGR